MSEINCKHCVQHLGVDSKLKIYEFLQKNGKKSATEIVEHLQLRQPTVSYHLKNMTETGLINSSREGRRTFYQINTVCPKTQKACKLSQLPL